jgi:hypothetical protein
MIRRSLMKRDLGCSNANSWTARSEEAPSQILQRSRSPTSTSCKSKPESLQHGNPATHLSATNFVNFHNRSKRRKRGNFESSYLPKRRFPFRFGYIHALFQGSHCGDHTLREQEHVELVIGMSSYDTMLHARSSRNYTRTDLLRCSSPASSESSCETWTELDVRTRNDSSNGSRGNSPSSLRRTSFEVPKFIESDVNDANSKRWLSYPTHVPVP